MKNLILLFIIMPMINSCFYNKHTDKNQSKAISIIQINEKQQHCPKCDIKCLVELSKNINNPTDKQIENFLLTFDDTCKNNIEYSEFSNELLFQVLLQYPRRIVRILHNNNNIELNVILNELSDPINDGIDINLIIDKLNRLNDKIANKMVGALLKIKH